MEVLPHPHDARFTCLTGAFPRDEGYWDRAVEISKSQLLAVVFSGNQHYYNFLFVERLRVDFALSARPDLPVDETAVAVPELMVRALIDTSLSLLRTLLERIRSAGGPGAIVLGTPPPKSDADMHALREKMYAVTGFCNYAQRAGGDLATAALTSATFHLKFWLLLQARMHALADEFGMPFCGAPCESQREDGFLRPGLWNDVTHANESYGQLMLARLARQVWPGSGVAEL